MCLLLLLLQQFVTFNRNFLYKKTRKDSTNSGMFDFSFDKFDISRLRIDQGSCLEEQIEVVKCTQKVAQ